MLIFEKFWDILDKYNPMDLINGFIWVYRCLYGLPCNGKD